MYIYLKSIKRLMSYVICISYRGLLFVMGYDKVIIGGGRYNSAQFVMKSQITRTRA